MSICSLPPESASTFSTHGASIMAWPGATGGSIWCAFSRYSWAQTGVATEAKVRRIAGKCLNIGSS